MNPPLICAVLAAVERDSTPEPMQRSVVPPPRTPLATPTRTTHSQAAELSSLAYGVSSPATRYSRLRLLRVVCTPLFLLEPNASAGVVCFGCVLLFFRVLLRFTECALCAPSLQRSALSHSFCVVDFSIFSDYVRDLGTGQPESEPKAARQPLQRQQVYSDGVSSGSADVEGATTADESGYTVLARYTPPRLPVFATAQADDTEVDILRRLRQGKCACMCVCV